MYLISRLTLSVAFVSRLSSVFCSIHFDEVEFYDPNKTLDESNSNGFECAHLGEECQITAQCCGVATCALPSWSANPVCLVPGYKHDERFRKRFLSVHHLKPEDIRYIRDSYNTSQYDFLLADLTFSAPPLNDSASANSSGIQEEVTNVTGYDGTLDNFGDVDGNWSLVSSSVGSLINSNWTGNVSLVEHFVDEWERGTNDSIRLFSNSSIYDNHESHGNIVKINSTHSSQIEDLGFKSHFMFLMVNNTLRQNDPELDVKAFYDQVLNTDKFKNIVKQLKEKMKTLNELENRLNDNTENATLFMNNDKVETVKPTTQIILSNRTTERPSRWNIIKRFILHSKEISNSTSNITNNKKIFNINDEGNEISPKEMPVLKKKESVKVKSSPQNENPSGNEGFKKIMEDVDKIEKIIDRDRRINEELGPGTESVNSDDQVDFYNIDVPLASFDALPGRSEGMNNSLESVFKDIGDTIKLMITDTEDNGRSELNQSLVEMNTQGNYIQNKLSVSNESALATSWRGSNKTHFWNKIHFWRVPQNFSAEFEKSLKNLFSSKKKSGVTVERSNQTHLNEMYLLNLNSKNSRDTTQIKEEPVEHTSELSYTSYSESDSTSAEELYNDSYVFMVNKKQTDEPVKLTSWKRVLNLFRREKLVPLALDVGVNDNLEGISGDHECNPALEVPKIIRLPEYLMPEALEERQRNETNWIYDDSDLEDRPVEIHKSSNSSFLFFFK